VKGVKPYHHWLERGVGIRLIHPSTSYDINEIPKVLYGQLSSKGPKDWTIKLSVDGTECVTQIGEDYVSQTFVAVTDHLTNNLVEDRFIFGSHFQRF
jgi:hypothetical protein